MKLAPLSASGLLVVAVAALSSCGDRTPTAPAPSTPPETGLIGDLFDGWFGGDGNLLGSCLASVGETVTKEIGPGGGVIGIGPDTLRIPPGALNKPVTITATLPAGYFVNVVGFQPDGLKFKKATQLVMGYSQCDLLGGYPLKIAQVTDSLTIIEYLPSVDDRPRRRVLGTLRHFSNYAVAW